MLLTEMLRVIVGKVY